MQITGHKLWWHPDRVEELYETGDSRPIYVEVGLTNRCNYECFFCGLDWARGKNKLETKTFKVLLNASYLGSYYLYGIQAEAMYDNDYFTRTKGRWIEVVK